MLAQPLSWWATLFRATASPLHKAGIWALLMRNLTQLARWAVISLFICYVTLMFMFIFFSVSRRCFYFYVYVLCLPGNMVDCFNNSCWGCCTMKCLFQITQIMMVLYSQLHYFQPFAVHVSETFVSIFLLGSTTGLQTCLLTVLCILKSNFFRQVYQSWKWRLFFFFFILFILWRIFFLPNYEFQRFLCLF